jgi:hypothetical protein
MSGLSTYTEELTLDYLLTLAPFWVGLHTGDPLDDDTGPECVGSGYARIAVTLTRAGSVLSNSNLAIFPESTGSWGTLTHFALYDAVSAGNQIGNYSLAYSKAVDIGEILSFPIGSLTVTAN